VAPSGQKPVSFPTKPIRDFNFNERLRERLERAFFGHPDSDALHRVPERGLPLAQPIHEMTGVNAFFAIQFLREPRKSTENSITYTAAGHGRSIVLPVPRPS
jgi:hypothetical protein